MSDAKEPSSRRDESARSISGSAAKNVLMDDHVEEEETLDEAKPKSLRQSTVGWEMGESRANEKESAPGPNAGSNGGEGAEENSSSAESMTKSSRRRRSTGENNGVNDSKTKQKNRHFEDEDIDTTAIVEIPDLEEEERDPDITTKVAEAPRNINRSVQTLKELDKDIKNALPNSSNYGVDLQLLTSVLCPERALVEADEPWTFDSLINEVAQEIQKDSEEKEELQHSEHRSLVAATSAATTVTTPSAITAS